MVETFEELRASVDERTVTEMIDGFRAGRGTGENDASDEAFVAMLLGVREEVVTLDFWWFRSQSDAGAECEIHYAMKVDDLVLEQRQKFVRDFVDTTKWKKKQRRLVEDLLMGWLDP